ncbi:hypothetical protein [Rhizobium mesoamericanum]|uniref:hypothetical protein n=1 Tax=Rhizobium mesoamericanum TaxID=1079800 RepID=UPI001AEBD48C|nr:hypothetical protein [Rhizobium mesoamericanum]
MAEYNRQPLYDALEAFETHLKDLERKAAANIGNNSVGEKSLGGRGLDYARKDASKMRDLAEALLKTWRPSSAG